jgi:hypothetical protein
VLAVFVPANGRPRRVLAYEYLFEIVNWKARKDRGLRPKQHMSRCPCRLGGRRVLVLPSNPLLLWVRMGACVSKGLRLGATMGLRLR